MKRFAPLSALVVLAVAIMPAAALAHHHEGRHHRHKRSHRHHARHRTERFGERGSTPDGPAQQGQGTAPAPAGTIQSFDNGTLTIMLADGSVVSGQVTNRTEIECRMDNEEPGNGDNDMRTDDQGPSGSGSGGPGPDGNGGSGDNGSDNGSDNDGNGNDNDGNEHNDMCSATALTVNASVSDAGLSLTSAGAIWTRVDLASS